jgi:hypothetical protein
LNFFKICGDIRELLFITGVNDTGVNCSAVSTTPAKNVLPVSLTINLCHRFSAIAGVVDTGEQFITGDNDTGNNFPAGDNNTGNNFVSCDNDTGDNDIVEQLSPVTTTPAINLLSVTRTRTPWRWGAAKDRRKLKGINRRYLRPPK